MKAHGTRSRYKAEKLTVFTLERHGDDYHGGTVLMDIYADKILASQARKVEEAKSNPCHPAHPQCDHKYSYSISEFEVRS